MFTGERLALNAPGVGRVRRAMAVRAAVPGLAAALCVAFCLLAPLRCVAQAGAAGRAPTLEARGPEDDPEATSLDARVLAPVTVPADASGRYGFRHAHDSIEADFGPDGVSGYITVMGAAGAKKGEPLTYFFAKTTLSGNRIHFLTHQVHRVRYEFDGTVTDTGQAEAPLARDYVLRGTLTVHEAQPDGSDHARSSQMEFRKLTFPR